MYTKNYYSLLFCSFLLLSITSCKNDIDDGMSEDGTNPIDKDAKVLLLQTTSWFVIGHHDDHQHPGDTTFLHTDTAEYFYDSNNRLDQVNDMQFIYNTDGTLSKTISNSGTVYYFYKKGLLTSVATTSGYYDGGTFTDTTRFYYSNGNIRFLTSTHEQAEIVINYDDDSHTTAKYITRKINTLQPCDSLLYTWENGNLIKLESRAGYPNNDLRYEREYRYDNHPCYNSAIRFPDAYLFIRELTQFYGKYPLVYYDPFPWRFNCTNNPVEFIEKTNFQTVVRPYLIDYDKDRFPVKIAGTNFIMRFTYNH